MTALGLTTIWYGNGLASVVVMGGMWSLSRFTMEIILYAAFSSDLVMARRTLRTSVRASAGYSVRMERTEACYRHTSLGPWLSKGNVQGPLLPADILVCLAKEVCLSPLLLKELYCNLPSTSRLMCAVYGPEQGVGLLLDECFQVDIVNGGEGKVKQVAGQR